MSMRCSVVISMSCLTVKPADEDYKRKAAAYYACRAAKVSIPKELDEFFNGEEPDPTNGVTQLGNVFGKDLHASCVRYKGDSSDGFEIDITKLPTGTRFVRFCCSW